MIFRKINGGKREGPGCITCGGSEALCEPCLKAEMTGAHLVEVTGDTYNDLGQRTGRVWYCGGEELPGLGLETQLRKSRRPFITRDVARSLRLKSQ